MSEWSTGVPENPKNPRELREAREKRFESKETQLENESRESANNRSEGESDPFGWDRTNRSDTGSGYDVIEQGRYQFLPVFGFHESNVLGRRYIEREGLGEIDTLITPNDEPVSIAGEQLSWWESDSAIPQHPFLLVNPLDFGGADPDVHNFRDVYKYNKGEQFVLSDSGGYQVMSRDDAEFVDSRDMHDSNRVKIHPESLLEWQVYNADAGATIDLPPYAISSGSKLPDSVTYSSEWREIFEDRLEQSQEYTRRMARRLKKIREEGNKQADDFLFCPVIHGKSRPDEPYEMFHQWGDAMLEASEEEGIFPRGWVLKPEPAANFGQLAAFLGFAGEYLHPTADYIHCLMVGGNLSKCLMMYYAMLSGQFVTSDASSFAAGGKRKEFFLPNTGGRRSVIISGNDTDEVYFRDKIQASQEGFEPDELQAVEDEEIGYRYKVEVERDGVAQMDSIPCRCSVCDSVEREYGSNCLYEMTGSFPSAAMNLHNLNQMLTTEKTIRALLHDAGEDVVENGGKPEGSDFWRFISSLSGEKRVRDLYKAMDFLRIAMQEDLDTAHSHYTIRWEKSHGRTVSYGSESAASDW